MVLGKRLLINGGLFTGLLFVAVNGSSATTQPLQLAQAEQTVLQPVTTTQSTTFASSASTASANQQKPTKVQSANNSTKTIATPVSAAKTAQTTVATPPVVASVNTAVNSSVSKPVTTAAANNDTSLGTAVKIINPSFSSNQNNLLSLNFQNIKVRAVLQLIAEFTGLNIVASDSVQGSITLHLNNVPWQQALDIILQSQGLAKRQVGNVILIAPLPEVATHEKENMEAQQQVIDLSPLHSELIAIKYGKAEQMGALLKGQSSTILSSRGNVTVDARTNTLWVQDTTQRLTEIRNLISRLDVPVRQVLIEARIVNIDNSAERDLGIRFGVTQGNHITGTLNGANQLATGSSASNISVADRLNMDLPSIPSTGLSSDPTAHPPYGTLGIALAKLSGGILLDLELSALETEGLGEVIANPRVITADQQAAIIQQGQEIPYQQVSSSGATNVEFKDAVLKLEVTPQITPDGRIILALKVHQDKVATLTVQGVPAIDTRSLETQVLVDNGETIVLGGVYQLSKTDTVQRIPFLGALPVIGPLFRNNQVISDRQELLIFVTPKIIQQALAAAS